ASDFSGAGSQLYGSSYPDLLTAAGSTPLDDVLPMRLCLYEQLARIGRNLAGIAEAHRVASGEIGGEHSQRHFHLLESVAFQQALKEIWHAAHWPRNPFGTTASSGYRRGAQQGR